jgi:FKBP-type peptidyl-prolyl cis-trans isomerase FkpA
LAFDIEIVDQKVFDKNKTLQYISDNKLEVDSTLSGIYYVIHEPGEGEHPTSSSTVTVSYKGTYLDGRVFDQADIQSFGLNGLIQGWKEAIPLLKPGGRGTFLIPSALGYGTTGSGSIPGNAVLVFEVELIDFN